MNDQVRVTSEVVRVRGHFLTKLTEFQWSLAKHGIAAGEAETDDKIRIHLVAAGADLEYIAESGRLLGFGDLADHASQTRRMIELFLERCLGTPNAAKLLTDVILDINKFVVASRKLTEQPTVLENIDIPLLSERIEHELKQRLA